MNSGRGNSQDARSVTSINGARPKPCSDADAVASAPADDAAETEGSRREPLGFGRWDMLDIWFLHARSLVPKLIGPLRGRRSGYRSLERLDTVIRHGRASSLFATTSSSLALPVAVVHSTLVAASVQTAGAGDAQASSLSAASVAAVKLPTITGPADDEEIQAQSALAETNGDATVVHGGLPQDGGQRGPDLGIQVPSASP